MENELKYVPMYKSYIDAVSKLNDNDRLKIYEAIFEFGFTGNEPVFENPYLEMGWNLVKPNLVNNINNAIKNKENGKKGGRPPKAKEAPQSTEKVEVVVEDQKEEMIQLNEPIDVLENNKGNTKNIESFPNELPEEIEINFIFNDGDISESIAYYVDGIYYLKSDYIYEKNFRLEEPIIIPE